MEQKTNEEGVPTVTPEVCTLKDVRDILNKIPDEDLDRFGIGPNFESDGEINILYAAKDEEDILDGFDRHKESLEPLAAYLKNICDWAVKADEQVIFDEWGNPDDGFITDLTSAQ